MNSSIKIEPGLTVAGGGSRPQVVVRVPAGFDVTIESVTGKTMTVAVDDIGNKKQLANIHTEEKNMIQVFVYDLVRLKKDTKYKVNCLDKVYTLKYQIFSREGILPRSQIFSDVYGKSINDLISFQGNQIGDGDVIKFDAY